MYSDIVKSYRGWHKFESKRFDEHFVKTKGYLEFRNHKEILDKFESLLGSFNVESVEDEFIKSKLIASIYLLRHKLGEQIDYFEYVKNTIGIEPKKIQEGEITSLITKIKKKLHSLGIKYTKRGIKKGIYLKKITRRGFSEQLERERPLLIKKTESYLGLKLRGKVHLEFVNKNEYWHYSLNTKEKGFSLKVNLNPSRTKHKKGSLKYAIMHELCGHALQLGTWKEQVRKGNINEVCGCVEDYGPESFSLEGVGESIFYFVFKDDIDDYLELELMFDELEHKVQNNAYIMINTGKSIIQTAKYYTDRVIQSERNNVKRSLKEIRDDSFLRAYRPVYGLSLLFFKKIAKNLNEKQRQAFLKKLYLTPMTFQQIRSEYLKLKVSS
jgi:hypothetical protein